MAVKLLSALVTTAPLIVPTIGTESNSSLSWPETLEGDWTCRHARQGADTLRQHCAPET